MVWPSEQVAAVSILYIARGLLANYLVGSILGGVLFIRIKHTKVQFIIATTTMTLFIGLMASVDPTTPARGIAFVTIAAFANGYCGTSGLLIVQLGASDSHIGLASG
jgi:hypothetical protein